MLPVEVTNVQTGVWEHRDGRWCESRAWRFVEVNDLVSFFSKVSLFTIYLPAKIARPAEENMNILSAALLPRSALIAG